MQEKENRKVRAGGVALAIGALLFFVVEYVTSLRWADGKYSYISEFISSLGIPVVVGHINSPWHALMNFGFVAYGLLVVIGYILLKHGFPKGALATVATVMLVASGIGAVLVGFFPGHDWEFSFVHAIGAMLVIYAGNIGAILLSIKLIKEKAKKWMWIGILLSIVGIAFSFVMAMFYESDFAGLYERIAIYPTIVFNLVMGITSLKK